ncbi:MAG: hypothetical protein WBA22_19610 [Candidatus Methanofastidiosia archaeon]
MVNEKEPRKKKNLIVIAVCAVLAIPLYLYVILEAPCLTCAGALLFVVGQIPLIITALLFSDRKRKDRYILYILLVAFAYFMINFIDIKCMIFGR